MCSTIMGGKCLAKKYFKVDVLAPERALGPDYDRQSIRQDHFISQNTQIS